MPILTRVSSLSPALSLALCFAGPSLCQEPAQQSPARTHVLMTLDSVRWTSRPQLPGLSVAVLEGDPNVAGSAYTIWVKATEGMPGAVLPAHWHPTDERIVVLRGVMGVGMGEVFDRTRGREYPAGSYVMLPARMRHFAWVRGETIMQVYGVGPFVTCFINPSEDPAGSAAPRPATCKP